MHENARSLRSRAPLGTHLAHLERRRSDGAGELGSQRRADVAVQAHGFRVLHRAVRGRQDEAVDDLGGRSAGGLWTDDEFHWSGDISTIGSWYDPECRGAWPGCL